MYKWRIQVFLVFFFFGIGSRKNHSINWRKWLALHDAPVAVETNASWSIRNFIISHSGKPLTCSRQITLSKKKFDRKCFRWKVVSLGRLFVHLISHFHTFHFQQAAKLWKEKILLPLMVGSFCCEISSMKRKKAISRSSAQKRRLGWQDRLAIRHHPSHVSRCIWVSVYLCIWSSVASSVSSAVGLLLSSGQFLFFPPVFTFSTVSFRLFFSLENVFFR